MPHQLASPPPPGRARELWLQHVAGFILFEDVRGYALGRIDPNLDDAARAAAIRAIDDAVYGLMMVIDGVSGSLGDEARHVSLAMAVSLDENGTTESLPLADGDGMCMGYHAWREGNFGDDPIVI